MGFFYLIRGLILLLKKYLDQQAELSPFNHYLPEKEENTDEIHDVYCYEYFDNLVKCLIFCTYNAEKFCLMPYEIVSIRSLKDDLDDIFNKNRFESLFRNELIEENLRTKLLYLEEAASTITDNEWISESVDLDADERWIEIKKTADKLLTEMGIEQRINNVEY